MNDSEQIRTEGQPLAGVVDADAPIPGADVQVCIVTGLSGAGKSTHIPFIEHQLQQLGVEVVVTREPGGTPLGEKLRELLLHEPMDTRTETLLMFAVRNEHIKQTILPALTQGKWVLCDRFSDASFARTFDLLTRSIIFVPCTHTCLLHTKIFFLALELKELSLLSPKILKGCG